MADGAPRLTPDYPYCPLEREWFVRALDWGWFVKDETKVGVGPDGFRVRAVGTLPLEQLLFHRIELRSVQTEVVTALTLITAYFPPLGDDVCELIAAELRPFEEEGPLVFVIGDAPRMATARRPRCNPVLAAAGVAASKCLDGWEDNFPIRVSVADASWDVMLEWMVDHNWKVRVLPG